MKRTRILIAACVLAILAFVVWVPRRPLQFETNRWTNNPFTKSSNQIRDRMTDDLVRRVLTPDLSRSDTVRLLGQPDSSFNAGEYFGTFELTADTDCYILHNELPEYGLVDPTDVLLIEYDNSKRLTKSYRSVYST